MHQAEDDRADEPGQPYSPALAQPPEQQTAEYDLFKEGAEQGELEVVLSVDGENVPFLNGDELVVRRSDKSLLMAKICSSSGMIST